MRRSTSGFTIVELLIVIVVIGILAAITIVAYNGVQNRANEAAVKSNLASLVKALEIYKTNSPGGTYPIAGTNTQRQELETIQFRASTGSYSTTFNTNLSYFSAQNGTGYVLLATAKTGTAFYVKNGGSTIYTYDNGSTPTYPNSDATQIFNKAMNGDPYTYSGDLTNTYVGNGGGWRFWN